jgi:putative membrane protein
MVARPGTWWPVVPLLWLVLVMIGVTVAFLLIRRAAQRQSSRAAEEKLAQRYAAGDITEDEYRERLSVLRAHER